MNSTEGAPTGQPIVTAELRLRGIQDRATRDGIRSACRSAQRAPVPIKGVDGRVIGAIVTEGQAREVAWREIVRSGPELGEP